MFILSSPQIHDADQRKKWSVHDRQRQHNLPHSEPRVSFPEGSTCPLIEYSAGWGKLLFLVILLFNVLCSAIFSWCFLKILHVEPFLLCFPPFIYNLVTFPSYPCCSVSQVIDISCRTLGARRVSDSRACQRQENDHPCPGEMANEMFYTFSATVDFLFHTVLLCKAQQWAPQGGGGGWWLISPCNTRLRLLLACLCGLGHTGPSSPQQQVHMHESLSHSLTENTGKEIAACSCSQLRFD